MAEYREIITKSVVAKGRKFTKSHHTIAPPHQPSSILGCWIINHVYEAKKIDKKVEVTGSFDINLWYSHHNNTKTSVVTERIEYKDYIKLKYRDENCFDDHEVTARVLQQPNCLEATISDCGKKVIVQAEREFLVEVLGETKICVLIHPDGCGEDEWDCFVDEEDLDEIDPNFLNEKEHHRPQ